MTTDGRKEGNELIAKLKKIDAEKLQEVMVAISLDKACAEGFKEKGFDDSFKDTGGGLGGGFGKSPAG